MASGMSWIKKVGIGIVKGFEWLGSDNGRKVIAAGETAIDIAFPAAAPVVAIVNAWMGRAAVIEGKAQAAASIGVSATGPQKAAAAIAAVAPDIEAILQEYKMLPLSADAMAKINDAVLVIANELTPAA
jgi:hypothetical protein